MLAEIIIQLHNEQYKLYTKRNRILKFEFSSIFKEEFESLFNKPPSIKYYNLEFLTL